MDFEMILGCKQQFKPKILSGSKKHTIRKGNRWKAGMKIHFVTGVRTKKQEQFMYGICTGTQDIAIFPDEKVVSILRDDIEEYQLSDSEIEELAKNDGFDSVNDFWTWFNKHFEGQIIHWTEMMY